MMPPYAKLILARRKRKLEPVRVMVVFSAKWYAPPERDQDLFPQIMVSTEDYAPGKYDFSALAGVAAQIITDLDEFSLRPVGEGPPVLRYRPRLLQLAVEVAARAAPLYISRGSSEAEEWFEYADLFGRYFSAVDESTGLDQYLGYTTAAAMSDYLRRGAVYVDFIEPILQEGRA